MGLAGWHSTKGAILLASDLNIFLNLLFVWCRLLVDFLLFQFLVSIVNVAAFIFWIGVYLAYLLNRILFLGFLRSLKRIVLPSLHSFKRLQQCRLLCCIYLPCTVLNLNLHTLFFFRTFIRFRFNLGLILVVDLFLLLLFHLLFLVIYWDILDALTVIHEI